MTGLSLTMQPAHDGVPVSDVSFAWEIYGIIERSRSNFFANGSATDVSKCVDPATSTQGLFPSTIDPFMQGDPTKECNGWPVPCGTFYRALNATNWDCVVTTEPGFADGLPQFVVNINYTDSNFPDFWLYANFHIKNDTTSAPSSTPGALQGATNVYVDKTKSSNQSLDQNRLTFLL